MTLPSTADPPPIRIWRNARLATLAARSAGIARRRRWAAASGSRHPPAQARDFHSPMVSSAPLEAVRATVRKHVAQLDDDRYMHPDLEAAISLVRTGSVVAAVGVRLPQLSGAGA